MRKPNVVEVTASVTLLLSMSANAWYGIGQWERGGAALIIAGVWMPIAIVLLERIIHATKLGWWFGAGIGIVAALCIYFSMSHLAYLSTPTDPSFKEIVDGWIFAVSVDIVMILSGIALAVSRHRNVPAAEVVEVEKIVEVQVPVEVEKIVYVEVPAAKEVAEVEETETVTETRSVTRTRRAGIPSGMTAEQHVQVLELIAAHRHEIETGVRGVAAEIMRKVEITGHTNIITRLPEWKAIKS